MMDAPSKIVQLKTHRLGLSPMIWRRVQVTATGSLRELHCIIQVALGREGYHLFLFDVHAVKNDSFELHAGSTGSFVRSKDLCGMAICMTAMWPSMVGSWILTRLKRSTPATRPCEKPLLNSRPTSPIMLGRSPTMPIGGDMASVLPPALLKEPSWQNVFLEAPADGWSKTRAHLMLHTRARTLDGTLRTMSQQWYLGIESNGEQKMAA